MDQISNKYDQSSELYQWLLEGDPAVVWQVLDNLLDSDPKDIHLERLHIELTGWGKSLIDLQNEDGTWNNRAFNPKFSATIWSLVALKRFGIYPLDIFKPAGLTLLEHIKYTGSIVDPESNTNHICLTALVLDVLSYFKIEDKRRDALLDYLIETQLDNGSWSCFVEDEWHSPLVVTLIVLEALNENLQVNAKYGGIIKDMQRAGNRFLLEHKLFKDPSTGKILDESYLEFPFPYFTGDILTMLDYFQSIDHPYDPKFEDAIEILFTKEEDFRWTLSPLTNGNEMVLFETPGDPSRWNTLRALRVIKWWRKINRHRDLKYDYSKSDDELSMDDIDKNSNYDLQLQDGQNRDTQIIPEKKEPTTSDDEDISDQPEGIKNKQKVQSLLEQIEQESNEDISTEEEG